jgi:hypothetical protein
MKTQIVNAKLDTSSVATHLKEWNKLPEMSNVNEALPSKLEEQWHEGEKMNSHNKHSESLSKSVSDSNSVTRPDSSRQMSSRSECYTCTL